MLKFKICLVTLLAIIFVGSVEWAEAAKPLPQDPPAIEQQLTDHDTDIQTLLFELLSRQQSWDQTLPAAERFVLVMGGAAVLDHETGLVWQKEPGDINGFGGVTEDDRLDWEDARYHCANLNDGGRKGWRLPSVHELNSLVDLNGDQSSLVNLPTGHPFSSIQDNRYWSATVSARVSTAAWAVRFNADANPKTATFDDNKNFELFVWCVRGGQNHGDTH